MGSGNFIVDQYERDMDAQACRDRRNAHALAEIETLQHRADELAKNIEGICCLCSESETCKRCDLEAQLEDVMARIAAIEKDLE